MAYVFHFLLVKEKFIQIDCCRGHHNKTLITNMFMLTVYLVEVVG